MKQVNEATLLLADRSTALRWLVLRDLFQDPNAEEFATLESNRVADPLVEGLVHLQRKDGAWERGDGAWRGHSHPLMLTCMALTRLGHMGFSVDLPAVESGVEFLFSKQRKDGSWPLPKTDDAEGVTEAPMQTAFPLHAIAACGSATDPRAEKAYDWLLSRRLDDGAWPTGKMRGDFRRVAGYRRIPQSSLGCRSNTTIALQALSLHPTHAHSPAARTALGLVLGRDTKDAHALGADIARLLGAEPAAGFLSFFARFDLATILDLCARIGASTEDQRVAEVVHFVNSLKSSHGLWTHPTSPQCSRWLTYQLQLALHRVTNVNQGWVEVAPTTPFKPSRKKRF